PAGDDEKNRQGMAVEKVEHRILRVAIDPTAFGRANFEEVLRRNDEEDGAAPVGNRVAEEAAPPGVVVRSLVEEQPPGQDRHRDDAQRVLVEKLEDGSPLLPLRHFREAASSA